MKKTLGQIVYEHPQAYAGAKTWPWSRCPDIVRAAYNNDATLAKRAVLRELRREGRLAPVKSQIISITKARKK